MDMHQNELQAVEQAEAFVVDDSQDFFAPTTSDALDPLLGAYEHQLKCIHKVAEFMTGPEHAAALHFFVEGNSDQDRGRTLLSSAAAQLFQLEGAVAQLNATYWSKALGLTDVLDMMPQKRRNEWNEQIRNPLGVKKHRDSKEWESHPLPDFTPDTVRSTIQGLLTMRQQFFSERVDGIFRSLSHDHVTNVPEGFGRRMIIARALDEHGYVNHGQAGVINDLRCVIAKFMGREEPRYTATDMVLRNGLQQHRGEWVLLDGGTIRIRVYKVGTAHLEVHPDIAYRLNQVLAFLHPAAIPAQFRTKPKTKPKDWVLMGKPLPFPVVELLGRMRTASEPIGDEWRRQYRPIPMAMSFDYSLDDKGVRQQAEAVLRAIGGVEVKHYWQFDYHPGEVIRQIVASGCIPDAKSHQFYPTPASLARRVVDLAEIGDSHQVLEPSAGTGGLADHLPKERTTCVEVSELHCAVLKAKGFEAQQDDFLRWGFHAAKGGKLWDRVVMNPPFSEGRWSEHLHTALHLVAHGGRLVAVLPSGAKTRAQLPKRFTAQWHGPFDNQFAGASVSVVILVADNASCEGVRHVHLS